MTAKFELKPTTDGQFLFNLIAANGQVVLTSQRYTTKAHAETGIASVRENAPLDERYDRLTSSADQPYFVLKGANHSVIGNSQMYSSAEARDKGIESVKTNGPIAELDDQC